MDNYDERMNYSFESADSDPASGVEDPAPRQEYHSSSENDNNKPTHDKKVIRKLVALVLVVALLGGVGGSVLTGVIANIQNKNGETVSTSSVSQTDTQKAAASSSASSSSRLSPAAAIRCSPHAA